MNSKVFAHHHICCAVGEGCRLSSRNLAWARGHLFIPADLAVFWATAFTNHYRILQSTWGVTHNPLQGVELALILSLGLNSNTFAKQSMVDWLSYSFIFTWSRLAPVWSHLLQPIGFPIWVQQTGATPRLLLCQKQVCHQIGIWRTYLRPGQKGDRGRPVDCVLVQKLLTGKPRPRQSSLPTASWARCGSQAKPSLEWLGTDAGIPVVKERNTNV